jgi:putative FmdB family regulatory protein
MPIYAYRCAACGHSKDVLQKMSDPVLSACPNCGAETFQKQLTAAGFQLKGSGWYVTDFRGGAKPAGEGGAAEAAGGEKKADKNAGDSAPADKGGESAPVPAAKSAAKPEGAAASPAPASSGTPSPAPASPPATGAK